jgi:hypothetical protein
MRCLTRTRLRFVCFLGFLATAERRTIVQSGQGSAAYGVALSMTRTFRKTSSWALGRRFVATDERDGCAHGERKSAKHNEADTEGAGQIRQVAD